MCANGSYDDNKHTKCSMKCFNKQIENFCVLHTLFPSKKTGTSTLRCSSLNPESTTTHNGIWVDTYTSPCLIKFLK